MLAGLLAGAAGLGGIAAAVTTAPYPVLAVAMGTAGFGMSMVMPAATAAVMEAAPPDRGGIASGVINAARQAGGVLGVALLGTLVRPGPPSRPASSWAWPCPRAPSCSAPCSPPPASTGTTTMAVSSASCSLGLGVHGLAVVPRVDLPAADQRPLPPG